MRLLKEILPTEKLEKLRNNGAIFFDVDDTLLARRKNPSDKDQVFQESQAALYIPLLLNLGVKVCIITGHGEEQLEKRLVLPLVEHITENFLKDYAEILRYLYVYANRGATKMVWVYGRSTKDEAYNEKFSLEESDLPILSNILRKLSDTFIGDFFKQEDYFRQKFPKFNFNEIPPKIIEREKVVLGLRPIPSDWHCATNTDSAISPLREMIIEGILMLDDAQLTSKYELTQSGKSTIEISKKQLSKKVAFEDLIAQIARGNQIKPELVEKSSIYVGDEFFPAGNDLIIAQTYSNTLCFSVASSKHEKSYENIIFLPDYIPFEGVSATASLMAHIIKFLT